MKAIIVEECHKCKPEQWEIERESAGTYFCRTCHKLFNYVLRRKDGSKTKI